MNTGTDRAYHAAGIPQTPSNRRLWSRRRSSTWVGFLVDAYRAAMGEEHPGTGILKGGLAKVLMKLEQYDEAAELLREAVENLTQNYGEERSRTVKAKEMPAEAEREAGS